jgi:branched-chain amino acid transport system substrate-binding protein
MKAIKLIAISVVLMLGAALIGCSRTPASAGGVSIGALLPLTGQDKSFGITQQRGMEVALGEINASHGIGGRPLTIEYGDTKLDEDLGIQEYKRLTAKGLVLMEEVTGSGVALRLAPYATKDQVVLLSSLDTSPKLTGVSPYFFRTIASDDYAGVVLSKWALQRGHRVAAIVYNTENAWSQGLKGAIDPAYKAQGGAWALTPIGVLNSTEDFSAAIGAIKGAKPPVQAVFVALMGRQAGLFVAQATANQLNTPFYGTDPFSQKEFIDNAKAGAERSLFALPAESKSQAYMSFATQFKSRYGTEPDSIAAKAYDALHLIAIVLGDVQKTGDLSGPRIREALQKASYEGITGPTAFDQNGDLREARFDRLTYKSGQRVPAE